MQMETPKPVEEFLKQPILWLRLSRLIANIVFKTADGSGT